MMLPLQHFTVGKYEVYVSPLFSRNENENNSQTDDFSFIRPQDMYYLTAIRFINMKSSKKNGCSLKTTTDFL